MKLSHPSRSVTTQRMPRAGDLQSPSAPSSSAIGRRLEVAGTGSVRQTGPTSGVALVATLIMLSLVTFMVVAFLGIARRERRSVEATLTAGEARNAAEYAVQRAQADLVARLIATGDKWNYGLMVPTNYQSGGISFTSGVAHPLNVNSASAYNTYYANPTPANLANYFLQNIANLQYDARVPVFSATSIFSTNFTVGAQLLSETNQGRFYYDFNRNGLFEPTDRFQTGDPHWVGVLENPGQPHGPNNRFLLRYTYLMAPVGKTLDLNLSHNQATRVGTAAAGGTEGYLRNLGVGPHEMNMAAMLAEINPFWSYTYDPITPLATAGFGFTDALNLLLFRNNGSFANLSTLDALFGTANAQTLVNSQFDTLGNGPLMGSTNLTFNVDVRTNWPGGTNTAVVPQQFYDMNDLFLTTRNYSGTFTANLTNRATNFAAGAIGDRDRRTFYDLLNILGVESAPVGGKLNLNWSNAPFAGTSIQIGSSGGDVSGFSGWQPDYFFYNAAELMIRASCSPQIFMNNNWTGFAGTDPLVLATNWFMGGGFNFNYVNTYYTNSALLFPFLYAPGVGIISNVYAGFVVDPNRTNGGGISLSVTNIPIYPFSYYSGEVHRLLQFAANLYDATTTNNASPAYPTLFRPMFAFQTNGWPSNDFIKIVGYTTNLTDMNLLSLPMYDLSDPTNRMAMYLDPSATVSATGEGSNLLCTVAGTPVIIGARKGYPNFNEFAVQTIASMTRKIELVKTNTNVISGVIAGPLSSVAGVPSVSPVPLAATNQNHILSLFNINAIEAWNSYGAAFPPAGRTFQLMVTNISTVAITNELSTNSGPLYSLTVTNGTNITINSLTWSGIAGPGSSFRSFLFTNVPTLSLSNYAGGANPFFAPVQLPGYAYASGTNYPPLTGLTNGGFIASGFSTFVPTASNTLSVFPDLRLGITITNSVRYALYEPASNRVVDFVTLTNLISGLDLAAALSATNGNAADDRADTLRRFFIPTRLGGAASTNIPTLGFSNQFAQSTNINLNYVQTNLAEWTGWRGSAGLPQIVQVRREIERLRRFLGLPPDPSFPPNQIALTAPPARRIQLPYSPTRIVAFSKSWEVNDPLVHYTTRDLENPYRTSVAASLWRKPVVPIIAMPPPPGSVYSPAYRDTADNYPNRPPAGLNRAYSPWGRAPFAGDLPGLMPTYYTVAPAAYDQRLKDAGVFNSDAWDFPQRKFANLGWIGRVHRGTPWQTFYLKSDQPNPTNWFYWAHSSDSSPTNDWRLVDVFSTALSADSTRGLLSVNQTNRAAWAAALGGALVLSNNGGFISPMVITPQTAQLASIVGDNASGLINAKHRLPMWNPAANYSPGDMVTYMVGFYGFANNYLALSGTNQGQNPFVQVSASNFSYWTNVPTWNIGASYLINQVVVHQGVAYYSLVPANSGFNPAITLPPTASPKWDLYYPSRSFNKIGKVLTAHELSTLSPYLNVGQRWNGGAYAQGARVYWQGWYYQALRAAPVGNPPNPYLNYSDPRTMAQSYWWPLESPLIARNGGTVDSLNDTFVERIPQQTLGLLTLEQSPRMVIYGIGQSLKPAERGIYVGGAGGGIFQGMVTNYQITGEFATRTVIRIDGLPEPGVLPRPLPATAPPQFFPRIVVESHKQTPPN